MIRSRHPSHDVLRRGLQKMPFRSVIRLGSTTKIKDLDSRIEINSVEAIQNSMDKRSMKKCFSEGKVNTARWWIYNKGKFVLNGMGKTSLIQEMPYPLVAKSRFGSRGKGNTKINTVEEMETFVSSKNTNLSRYIFEVFHSYSREYRLHVTKDGCFYTCRKMLKNDTPEKDKWFRNNKNCIWVREDSNTGLFDKPINWDEIVQHSVMALKAVGLDVGAVDVKVQSATNLKGKKRNYCEFFIIEINSAPSFGNITEIKYKEVLPKLLIEKSS